MHYLLDRSSRSVIIGGTPLGGVYYIALRGLLPQLPYIAYAAEVTLGEIVYSS